MRDIKKDAAEERAIIGDRQDITTTEMDQLRSICLMGPDGLFDALIMAYRAGYARGKRGRR